MTEQNNHQNNDKNNDQNNDPKKYLSVKQVSKSFGAVNVLNDIELACEKGELICLLGPSGCGKTTLLRIIAGLEQQDTGVLIQDGQDISALPAEKRDFGIVFQSYALFPNLTVEQNVAYGLRKQPKHEVKQRVESLLDTVGLLEHIKKYPAQLSGGQQQRVALARALAISPGLLLLDEPLSALDAKVRVHLRQEIKAIQRRLGITTIMVTHDQDEAMSMADKVVVMYNGKIEQVGSPAQVYTQPATPFVASFIGAMNFFPAKKMSDAQVSCLGKAVDCTVPESANENTELTLSVRPEQFVVHKGLNDNGLHARIDKVEFLGAFIRLYVDVLDDSYSTQVLVDVTNESHLNEQYDSGMDITLGFNTSSVVVYEGSHTQEDA